MMPTLAKVQQKELPAPPSVPNYFNDPDVALGYARVRPHFHQNVVEQLCSLTGNSRFGRALDVGCGSGHSTIALADVAGRVVGIDPSTDMLSHAPAAANITYLRGVAEDLSSTGGEFDLISVGSALHWFDQRSFFLQCQSALLPGGVLMVYNDHFTAHMQGVVECKRWMRTRFAKRYRPSKRGMRDMNEPLARECGFEVAHRVSFDHVVPFDRAEFVSYLLTRSNTLAAIRSGRETRAEVMQWLDDQLTSIVPDGVVGSFIFKCNIWILYRANALSRSEQNPRSIP